MIAQDTAPAAASAAPTEDPRAAVRRRRKQLRLELACIDGDIRKCEAQIALAGDDDDAVQELVQRREKLLRRKEALPFLLRGVYGEALRADSARLGEQADALKPRLEAAQSERVQAAASFGQAEASLRDAKARLGRAEESCAALARDHERLSYDSEMARTSAERIEQGLEPFIPNPYDESD